MKILVTGATGNIGRGERAGRAMGEYARWYPEGFGAMVERPQSATTTVADVTGSPATTFEQWATANADAFR